MLIHLRSNVCINICRYVLQDMSTCLLILLYLCMKDVIGTSVDAVSYVAATGKQVVYAAPIKVELVYAAPIKVEIIYAAP